MDEIIKAPGKDGWKLRPGADSLVKEENANPVKGSELSNEEIEIVKSI